MRIETPEHIEIRYARKASMHSSSCNNVQHIKSLPWLSVVQSQVGNYRIQLDDSMPQETGDGGFFIAPSQVVQKITHFTDPRTQQMRNRWVFLEVIMNHSYSLDDLYHFPTLVPEEMKAEMNRLFDQLFAADDICDEMSIYFQIIKHLLHFAVPKDTIINKPLLDVLDHIRQHYAEPLTVARLAAAAFLSESYLYELFRRNLGTSPIAYLNHYRLSVASELLKQTDEPVAKIAEMTGFQDPAYFTRLFRRTFHTNPRAYRRE